MKPTAHRQAAGFTVVELMVVLGTLGLLSVVLLPALANAKRRSLTDVCLANQRQFGQAWNMFNEDHGDYMVSAGTQYSTSDSLFSWRVDPASFSPLPTVPAGQSAVKLYDEAGFKAGGLYPYIKNTDVIHCPADNRYLFGGAAWCTYAMVDNMNGAATIFGTDYRLHKASQIKQPGARMILTEENDPRAESVNGFTIYENFGTWLPFHPLSTFSGDAPSPSVTPKFSLMAGGGSTGWWDGPAVFHPSSGTFSFCDGHAELHQWRNQNTLAFASSTSANKSSGPYSYTSVQYAGEAADLSWLYSHIATSLWP